MKKLLLLIIVLLLFYIFRAELLTGYARLFTLNTATPGADLMIVMSGNIATRPDYAVKLYNEGFADTVYLTQEKNWEGHLTPYVMARNDYAKMHMESLGVPVKLLPSIHEGEAMSTFDEAHDAAAFLDKNPDMRHVILVTDAPHTLRTEYTFVKAFKQYGLDNIQLEMAAAPNDVFDETNWFTTEKGILYYLEETLKMLLYWVGLGNSGLVTPR